MSFLKNIKGAIPALVAVLIAALVFFALYNVMVIGDNNTVIKSKTIGNITEFDDKIIVSQGEKLVQTYKENDLNYHQLGFNVRAVTDSAKVKVEISNQKSTQVITLKKADLIEGYTYVELDDRIKLSAEWLIVTFFVEEGTFEFMANKSIEIIDSSCMVDGKSCEKNVAIDLRTFKGDSGDSTYVVLAIVSILFLLSLVLIIKINLLKTEALVAFVLMFFCIICIFVFPPFTVPDEGTHYRSVYHMSNIIMLDFEDAQGSLQMRNCDYEFYNHGRNSLHDQKFINEENFDKVFTKDTQVIKTPLEYMTKSFIPHFAPGLGLAVARIIRLGPYWACQLARLFNAVMCIIFIYFSLKIIPYGKLALSAIALLPMSLHIMGSCSYDAFSLGGTMLIFAYILHLMYSDKKTGWKQFLLLGIMIIFVIPQKIVYIGIAALVLIIPREKFERPKRHFALKCCLAILALISIFVFQFSSTDKLVSGTVTYSGAEGYCIAYILSNPLQIIKMLFKTIIFQGDFYLKSLIAFFGWFELEPTWFMVVPYVVVLALSFMRVDGEPIALKWPEKLYSLIMFGISFLLIELLLLIDWTHMGSEIVLGVQGRYFIPALPALFLFARNNSVVLCKNFHKKLIFLISLLNSGIFVYCVAVVV